MNRLLLLSKRLKLAACLLFAASCLMLLGSCNTNLPQVDKPLQEQGSLQSLFKLSAKTSTQLDNAAVIALFGQPLQVETFPFPNHHVLGQIDTISIYDYEGLTFSVYTISASGQAFITDMTVSLPTYTTAIGLRVGSSRAEVENLIGQPKSEKSDEVSYQLSEANDLLVIVYKNDKISKMLWKFYWD